MQLLPGGRGITLTSGGRKHSCFIPEHLKKHNKNSIALSAYVRSLEAENVNC
jgi:hypothetical protein